MSFGSIVIRDPRETVTVRDDRVTVVAIASQGPQGPTPVTPGSVIAAPGDLIVGDALGDPTTLAIGAEHEILSVESGVLTWRPPARSVFDVRDYGAIGDGSNDDTAEIQAAIDACEAAGGGTVLFHAGDDYRVTGLIVDSVGVSLVGTGMGTARITMTAAAGDTLTFGTTTASAVFGEVRNLHIAPSVARNAGTAEVRGFYFSNLTIAHCRIEGASRSVSLGNTDSAKKSSMANVYNNRATDFDLWLYIVNCLAPFFRDNVTGTGRAAGAAIIIDGGVEGGSFIGGDHVNSYLPDADKTGNCLEFRKADYTVSEPRWLKFVGVHFDSYRQGISASAGTDLDFDGCWFSNRPWAGVAVGDNTKRFRFRGCDFHNNGTYGVLIDGGDQHRVVDCAVVGNNEAGGAADGIFVAGSTDGVQVRGCVVLNDSPFPGSQGWGIQVASGATNYTLRDNDCRGNATGSVTHPSGTGFIVADNR